MALKSRKLFKTNFFNKKKNICGRIWMHCVRQNALSQSISCREAKESQKWPSTKEKIKANICSLKLVDGITIATTFCVGAFFSTFAQSSFNLCYFRFYSIYYFWILIVYMQAEARAACGNCVPESSSDLFYFPKMTAVLRRFSPWPTNAMTRDWFFSKQNSAHGSREY